MTRHNFLVLSDVHLGSDLVQHARPDAPPRGSASQRRDRELVALLDWYRQRREGRKPWRLVIAGDFIDFAGMSVPIGPDGIATEPTPEERQHGLGSAADHTLAKLRQVAEHHGDVFAALARFLHAGNTLVIVRGNHDVDLHWLPVQDAFRTILSGHSPRVARRIEFADWFYYEKGVVYIEHGHQYDEYCSYEHVLHPVLPSDPRRSHPSLSDVLLRWVVRPTQGMLESGHDHAGFFDYLRFGARLGLGGLLNLATRFFSAVLYLVTLWREHFSEAARWVKSEHERKLALLAEARQISVVRLKALAKLQRPPVTRSLLGILASVMMDRIVLGLTALGTIAWLSFLSSWSPALTIGVCTLSAVMITLAWLLGRSRVALNASAALRQQSARVAALFPAAWIVMGHTHLPEIVPAKDTDSTYVNLGAWAEEDTPDGSAPPLPASRTHLVIREAGDRIAATLMRWDAEHGPRDFDPGA